MAAAHFLESAFHDATIISPEWGSIPSLVDAADYAGIWSTSEQQQREALTHVLKPSLFVDCYVDLTTFAVEAMYPGSAARLHFFFMQLEGTGMWRRSLLLLGNPSVRREALAVLQSIKHWEEEFGCPPVGLDALHARLLFQQMPVLIDCVRSVDLQVSAAALEVIVGFRQLFPQWLGLASTCTVPVTEMFDAFLDVFAACDPMSWMVGRDAYVNYDCHSTENCLAWAVLRCDLPLESSRNSVAPGPSLKALDLLLQLCAIVPPGLLPSEFGSGRLASLALAVSKWRPQDGGPFHPAMNKNIVDPETKQHMIQLLRDLGSCEHVRTVMYSARAALRCQDPWQPQQQEWVEVQPCDGPNYYWERFTGRVSWALPLGVDLDWTYICASSASSRGPSIVCRMTGHISHDFPPKVTLDYSAVREIHL